MIAPVTAVALLTKSPTNSGSGGGGGSGMTRASEGSSIPTMPNAPIQYEDEAEDTFVATLRHYQNTNVVVGNWEVQNAYKQNNAEKQKRFQNLFGEAHKIYDQAWNHFQDYVNHYKVGYLYRTQTMTVLDDVTIKSELQGKELNDDNNLNVDKYGERSSVAASAATINTDKNSTAYNTQRNDARLTYQAGIDAVGSYGVPYTTDRLDSINLDFKPEVILSGKWLKEDWDITKGWDSNVTYGQTDNKDWQSDSNLNAKIETIRLLRIHSSINFDGVYPARAEKYRERDEDGVTLLRDDDGNLLPDILWARIESEPMLNFPDIINYKNKTKYLNRSLLLRNGTGVTTLNSVNQIIINANCPNTGENDRPVIIFYEGPETNDVYETTESAKKHVRDSLPIIFNLNVPFCCILFVPNSPVVIIGKAKDDFRGFVVAKEYMRLKDDSDFINSGETKLWLGLERPIYYAKNDTNKTKPCYKTTDENGIDMFVDELGDIQFSQIDNPKKCGIYDTFGRTNLAASTDYFVAPHLAYNLLIMAPSEE